MPRWPSRAFAALLISAVAVGAWAQPPAKPAGGITPEVAPYQRSTEDRDGEVLKLEMAVREFTPSKPGQPKVYLAGAVHIAKKSFYEDLQKFLDSQDVVLFEGVKPPGAGSSEHDGGAVKTDEQKAEATKRRIRFLAMVVQRYQAKNGALPATLDELAAKSEGRIAQLLKVPFEDSWGNLIGYSTATATEGTEVKSAKFDLVSFGADGKPGGEGAAADLRFSDQKPLSKPETGDRSDGIQQKLADALGVVYQLTAMNHNKANWRNSDLSVDQIQARLEAEGANADSLFSMIDGSSVMGKMAGMLIGMLSASPESRAMLRVMMIETVAHADAVMAAKLPADLNKVMGVILEDRNRVVLADLKKLIDTEPGVKSVAIIYGAGHLPGVERALVADLGYTPAGDTWRTAMEVDTKDGAITAAQIKTFREMVTRMMESQAGSKKKPKPDPTTN